MKSRLFLLLVPGFEPRTYVDDKDKGVIYESPWRELPLDQPIDCCKMEGNWDIY